MHRHDFSERAHEGCCKHDGHHDGFHGGRHRGHGAHHAHMGPGAEAGAGHKGRHRGHHGGRRGGERGGFGGGGGMGRRRRLDGETLRLILLALLSEGARHGYDLIKAVEAKALGHYSPSPGVVYPALTYLEEADFIVSRPEGSKKVYALTETGTGHLADNRAAADAALHALAAIGERMEARKAEQQGDFGRGRDIPGAVPELNQARRALKAAMAAELAKGADAQKRLADILQKAVAEIEGTEGAEGADIDI